MEPVFTMAPPAGFLHALRHGLRCKKFAFEDCVQEPVILLFGHIAEGNGLEYTYVADQNVDAAELLLGRFDDCIAGGNFRHIRGKDRNTVGGSKLFRGGAKLCFIPAV
jgi:hypothetical protein